MGGAQSVRGRSGVGVGELAATALLVVAAATAPSSRDHRVDEPPPGPATTRSGVLGRLDLALQRRRVTSVPIAVVRKASDDRAGRLAALIAYYGFFSLFPALLALVTVLGFVLENDSGLRDDIAGSALAQFPIVGDSVAQSVSGPLTGSVVALVIGLAGALWAGMGTVQACQDAMNEVWAVERVAYPNFVMKRVRSLMMLAVLGLMLVVSTGLTQLVQILEAGPLTAVVLLAGSWTLDVALFAVAYRVLTVADVAWRTVVPGAALAGTAYVVLQYVGGLYVSRTVNGATETYGTFAVVIGLLSWIFLIAQVLVFGAELNVVLARRMWPRSLFGAATASDERSHAQQATSQRMDRSMSVEVEFDDRPADDT